MSFFHIDIAGKQATFVTGDHPLASVAEGAGHLMESMPPLGSDARIRLDSEIITGQLGDMSRRAGRDVRQDALTTEAGAMARDLNHRRKAIIEEAHALPNSMTLFPLDPDQPPPGARTHSVRYSLTHGEAVLHRGKGASIPTVGGGMLEDTFRVWPVVTSISEDYFERQSQQFAGYDPRSRDIRTARRVIEELMNRINWFGDEAAGLYGVTNYPRLPKKLSAVSFDGTGSPTDMLDELHSAANYPVEQSKGTMRPNRVVASPRIQHRLAQTRIGSVNDTSILEYFLRGQPDLGKMAQAWELEDAGGTGVDGILFYNDDPVNVSRIMPQGMTMLPPSVLGLSTVTIVAAVVGGVIMQTPGHAVLLLVPAA